MERLFEMQAIAAPSGREQPVVDYLEEQCSRIRGAKLSRVADVLFASKGKPRAAVVSHTDTIGFTLGYKGALIPIGSPVVSGGERLRQAGGAGEGTVLMRQKKPFLSPLDAAPPGTGWVFADSLTQKGSKIQGPYLDNRAGVWSTLRVLEEAPDVLAVFTTSEEHSGRGALLAARMLHEQFKISKAIIADITWHTDSVRCGRGVAVSLRDRFVPRQPFLETVLELAEASGVPYQREIESDGGSDGSYFEKSGYPIDWCFIGAPEKRPHWPTEELDVRDLQAMVDLTTYLVGRL